MNLFCCRHKVVRVDRASRKSYRDGRKLYAELEAKIKDFPKKVGEENEGLDYLTKQLQELPVDYLKYVRCLRDIKDYHNKDKANSDRDNNHNT
ncbi:MAG: hypothetical protein F6K35_28650 [Okeania sp. SIO2H7]|nr:hypothetical protein [Okeania sp. SIO2H7]